MKDGLANQCHDCLKEARRKWRESNPGQHKARHIKNRYGIALEEYEAMARLTGGRCPVCGEAPAPPFSVLDLDHDHETGRVRGLLCRGCNIALGGARDNPATLRALADYVEDHRRNPGEDIPPPIIPNDYVMGQSHPNAVLDDDKVRKIRALAAAGSKQSAIAAQFGVTQASVSLIVRRRTWRHVPD